MKSFAFAATAALFWILQNAQTVQSFTLPTRVHQPFKLEATVSPDATKETSKATSAAAASQAAPAVNNGPPFKNIMAANRAEIAVRIMRASTELNSGTVAIYTKEDKYSQHRWGADRSFELTKAVGASPISAYLDIPQIIQIAKAAKVDAIHPGYGFLSESPQFAKACGEAGITFVGPTVENLLVFSDKTTARTAAIEAGVPVVPGSDGALKTGEEVLAFVKDIGLPVILKAAMGGGGKGMRVVRRMEDVVPFFEAASSEALASFGDGSVFVERFVDRPRHIEVRKMFMRMLIIVLHGIISVCQTGRPCETRFQHYNS